MTPTGPFQHGSVGVALSLGRAQMPVTKRDRPAHRPGLIGIRIALCSVVERVAFAPKTDWGLPIRRPHGRPGPLRQLRDG
jgi:hypothetical protein